MVVILSLIMFIYCIKTNQYCGESNKGSPDRINNKKATINPINKKDSKSLQYAVTVVLNHEEIKRNPQKITKTKPFINKYKWERIYFPSEKDGWKKI